jgi:mono/diheme cytochrome c family protein
MLMPGEHYYDDMPDEDMSALIAYTRSLPPVDHRIPALRNGPYAHLILALGAMPIYAERIKHDSVKPFVPDSGVTVRNGSRLARMCFACHAKDLGGLPPGLGVPPGPNLTRGGALKDWSEEQFLHFIRTGTRPNGLRADPKVMPWAAFAMLRDDELRSLWAYLRSVPAVDRSVSPPMQPAAPAAKPAQPSST